MEEKSLKVFGSEKTFFSKISTTISRLLIPTQIGVNGMLISMKRNALLKAYEPYKTIKEEENGKKREAVTKKCEDAFSLYLEAIDKYIMDSIYKKVKNGTATTFEKDALSDYYSIINLKQNEYLEYKYRKQKYLLELDYETVSHMGKEKILNQFEELYIEKMDSLYKGILKNYAVKLADNVTTKFENKDKVFEKIFSTVEEYVNKVLKLKVSKDYITLSEEIVELYEKFDKFEIGKLDEKDIIEKNMIMLGISRNLFTHSLPLVVAEQCYVKLLKDTRKLIANEESELKQGKLYNMLIDLIDDYNVKLLSTKVYWEKPDLRDDYKKFWDKFKKLEKLKKQNLQKFLQAREILFLKYDIKKLSSSNKDFSEIIKLHKARLNELGAIKTIKRKGEALGNKKFYKAKGKVWSK